MVAYNCNIDKAHRFLLVRSSTRYCIPPPPDAPPHLLCLPSPPARAFPRAHVFGRMSCIDVFGENEAWSHFPEHSPHHRRRSNQQLALPQSALMKPSLRCLLLSVALDSVNTAV